MSDQVSHKSDDTLKFIALLTMLIDHIGYLLFPQHFILRVIGRLSFPIFAYLLARGARRTSNPKRYAFRLFTFALISQIPYNLFTNNSWYSLLDPNIFFTLLAGLLMLLCLRHEHWGVKMISVLIAFCVVPLNLSYSYYGLLLILTFYMFDKKPLMIIVSFLLATCQYYIQFSNPYQFYALPVLLIIFYLPPLGIRVPKWLGYGFYPTHLLILFAIYRLWF